MSIIAVAGGTGKLGRAIVDGITAAGNFEVVILAREVSILYPQMSTIMRHGLTID